MIFCSIPLKVVLGYLNDNICTKRSLWPPNSAHVGCAEVRSGSVAGKAFVRGTLRGFNFHASYHLSLMKSFKKYLLNPKSTGWKYLGWSYVYLSSYFKARKTEPLFKDVETYCMFLGYPRSGHTLVGSLLDAHPNIIIAQELDALKYVGKGFTKKQLFYLLLRQSEAFTRNGRKWSGYDYNVPNQWNGIFEQLKVIGDKKGGTSTRTLIKNSTLLERLFKTTGVKNKIIHVVRNPYDNITTIKNKNLQKLPLEQCIEFYFNFTKTNARVKQEIPPENIFDLKHESLIANPKQAMTDLCRFLGVDLTESYLNDCASIVFESPRKTRFEIEWSPEMIRLVADEIKKYPFLEGYTYDS